VTPATVPSSGRRILLRIAALVCFAAGLWVLISAGLPGSHNLQTDLSIQTTQGIGIGLSAPPIDTVAPDGTPIRLPSDMPLVLNFWATWCVPCRDEMPELQSLADDHAGLLRIVAVNSGEPLPAIRAWINTLELRLEVALDTDERITRLYQVVGLPTTYLINARGIIADVIYGPTTQEEIEARLFSP
jgi:thiol-disulfide isomerase/thioredoxin